MAEATVNGVRLAYDDHGAGSGAGSGAGDDAQCIVLVCGLGQPAMSWQLSILPGLVAAGYRVITFDNRGVSPSECPPAPYSLAEMAADTAGLIEHLGIGPCHVAGYSLGAWVAELLAADRPELVRSAACIGGLNPSTEWEKVEATYGRDLAALDVDLPPLQGLMELLVYVPRRTLQDDEQVRTFVKLFGNDPPWGNPGRLGQWEATVAWTNEDRSSVEARWSRISVPVLALAFEDDIDSPPNHARIAISHIATGRFVEIPNTTHLGPFEQPDAVVTALTNFFTTTASIP